MKRLIFAISMIVSLAGCVTTNVPGPKDVVVFRTGIHKYYYKVEQVGNSLNCFATDGTLVVTYGPGSWFKVLHQTSRVYSNVNSWGGNAR